MTVRIRRLLVVELWAFLLSCIHTVCIARYALTNVVTGAHKPSVILVFTGECRKRLEFTLSWGERRSFHNFFQLLCNKKYGFVAWTNKNGRVKEISNSYYFLIDGIGGSYENTIRHVYLSCTNFSYSYFHGITASRLWSALLYFFLVEDVKHVVSKIRFYVLDVIHVIYVVNVIIRTTEAIASNNLSLLHFVHSYVCNRI